MSAGLKRTYGGEVSLDDTIPGTSNVYEFNAAELELGRIGQGLWVHVQAASVSPLYVAINATADSDSLELQPDSVGYSERAHFEVPKGLKIVTVSFYVLPVAGAEEATFNFCVW